MSLLTQFRTFFISPFGEETVCDELNHFLKANRIINVDKKLIDSERGTGWLFLVEYAVASGNRASSSFNSGPKVDYREILSESEFALFDALRRLRKEIADKQGMPVYTVFSNEQLAAIARKPPKNLKDLGAIPGVGEAKLKQYGEPVLVLLKAKAQETETGKETASKKSGEEDDPLF
jgi:superfamily II DNA helicase RecQ